MSKVYVLIGTNKYISRFPEDHYHEILSIFDSMDKLNEVKDMLEDDDLEVEEYELNEITPELLERIPKPNITWKETYRVSNYILDDDNIMKDLFKDGYRYLVYNNEVYELKEGYLQDDLTILINKLPNVTVDDIK